MIYTIKYNIYNFIISINTIKIDTFYFNGNKLTLDADVKETIAFKCVH